MTEFQIGLKTIRCKLEASINRIESMKEPLDVSRYLVQVMSEMADLTTILDKYLRSEEN